MFYGGWVAVLPAVVMDRFGGRHVSSIIANLAAAAILAAPVSRGGVEGLRSAARQGEPS